MLFFVSGTFPHQLKTAKIFPVYKKGDPVDCTSYCPICLLPKLGKLIEKLTHPRMNVFLENWMFLQKSV